MLSIHVGKADGATELELELEVVLVVELVVALVVATSVLVCEVLLEVVVLLPHRVSIQPARRHSTRELLTMCRIISQANNYRQRPLRWR